MSTINLHSVKFDFPIWSILVEKEGNRLLIEERDEGGKHRYPFFVSLDNYDKNRIHLKLNWLERMVYCENGVAYVVFYENQDDPSAHQFYEIEIETGVRREVAHLPSYRLSIDEPFFYKVGSDHHHTIASFLQLELPLSCEYFEQGAYIMISYYLRSDDGFSRYLLLLKDGRKVWKIAQDTDMKGFASGAFFVFRNQLIFIKDQYEICFYPL